MWSFFADLVRNVGTEHIIVVMEAEEMGRTRRHRVRPSRMVVTWAGSLVAMAFIVGLLLAFTPLRTQIPGYGTEKIEESAQLNAMRLQALQDSLAAQRDYVQRLRRLITGRVDSVAPPRASLSRSPRASERSRRNREPSRTDESSSPERAHEQPAIALSALSASRRGSGDDQHLVSGLSFPVAPPVANGFPTRGFDAQTGHYGIDVVVSEGEFVRAVGDGYVVWADWTQDGGYTIAVQHAGGYLSVYRHNKRLLKQQGDRVTAQEPLAVTGNTGTVTTGPHLHFELWQNGLAQEPNAYVADW